MLRWHRRGSSRSVTRGRGGMPCRRLISRRWRRSPWRGTGTRRGVSGPCRNLTFSRRNMARSLFAACLAFAGIFVLAGPGWALLAGAFLVLVLWRRDPDWRAFSVPCSAAGRVLCRRLGGAPRRGGSGAGGEAAGGFLLRGVGPAGGGGAARGARGGGV